MSTREIAADVGLAQTTVRYWLNKFGLSTRRPKSTTYKCRHCGETRRSKMMKNGRPSRHHTLCTKCHSRNTIERYRALKRLDIEYMGGKCVRCGYDKCQAALEFHHLDPSKKDPNWIRSRGGVGVVGSSFRMGAFSFALTVIEKSIWACGEIGIMADLQSVVSGSSPGRSIDPQGGLV